MLYLSRGLNVTTRGGPLANDLPHLLEIGVGAHTEGRVVETEGIAPLGEKVQLGVARHGEDTLPGLRMRRNHVHKLAVRDGFFGIDVQAAMRQAGGFRGRVTVPAQNRVDAAGRGLSGMEDHGDRRKPERSH